MSDRLYRSIEQLGPWLMPALEQIAHDSVHVSADFALLPSHFAEMAADELRAVPRLEVFDASSRLSREPALQLEGGHRGEGKLLQQFSRIAWEVDQALALAVELSHSIDQLLGGLAHTVQQFRAIVRERLTHIETKHCVDCLGSLKHAIFLHSATMVLWSQSSLAKEVEWFDQLEEDLLGAYDDSSDPMFAADFRAVQTLSDDNVEAETPNVLGSETNPIDDGYLLLSELEGEDDE